VCYDKYSDSVLQILDMGYEDVVLSKEFIILKQLLKTDLLQRFKLASEFLGSSSLTNSEVRRKIVLSLYLKMNTVLFEKMYYSFNDYLLHGI